MYYLHHSATGFAAIIAGVIAATTAQAGGSRVGGTTSVVHDVSSSVSGQSWAKKTEGDDIYEDEFIRTAAESSARVSFIDETDIRMGPAARMKIDRVVFKSGRAVSELVVTAEAGPVRWNSGVSQSNAYLIKTPTVLIKVRGTTFDLFAEPQQTTVVLRRGTIEVCAIDNPQRCQTLSRPGDTVIGTPNVLDRPRRAGPAPSEFAERCLSARATAPCGILASVEPRKAVIVDPTRPGNAQPTRPVIVVPGSGSIGVPPDPPRRHVDYPSGGNVGPKDPRPKPDCYRNRRACQASVPPKPDRPPVKPPYVPKQKPTKVTQKPAYATQVYAQPKQTVKRVRPVYRPPPANSPR